MNKSLICRITKTLHSANGRQPLELSFELEQGRILAIHGPSGAGKTTLLRILAGLTDIDAGYVGAGGMAWCDTAAGIHVPARRRSVGMVFQDFALFPHLTARQNLEFALARGEDPGVVTEIIEMMELQSFQHVHPARLSGGQQQRVALGRAIVRRPALLLLDEALSALDDEMRSRLQDYILRAHRQYRLTTLLVSHSLPEIFRLADEVIRLDKGRIVGKGIPSEVLLPPVPKTTFMLTGEVVSKTLQDNSFTINVLYGHSVLSVTVTAEQAATFYKGQRVRITSDPIQPRIEPV